jgi:hypothetical protein
MRSEHASKSKIGSSLAPHELEPDADERYIAASPEHRARLQLYVKVTVGACVALCLAAIVRVGISRAMASEDDARPYVSAAVRAPEPVAPGTTDPPAPTTPPAAAPVATSAHPSAPAAIASAPKTAGEARDLARRALERGKARDALAAAEQATTLDPSDADAWLLLGAANQEMGRPAAARTAFTACVKSAKHGPVRERRAMRR